MAALARGSTRSCASATRSSRRSATSSTSAASRSSTRRSSRRRRARARRPSSRPYFDGKAYLTQTGQLYVEAGAIGVRQGLLLRPDLPRREVEDPPPPDGVLDGRARGRLHRVRRRHGARRRSSSRHVVARVLDRCAEELKRARARHRRARAGAAAVPAHHLHRGASSCSQTARATRSHWGDDFGGDEETLLAEQLRPAGDGAPLPDRVQGVLHAARSGEPAASCSASTCWRPRATARSSAAASAITTSTLAAARSREHNLPREAFEWYLDLRKYGSVPARRLRHGPRALRRLDLRARTTCARPSPSRACWNG